MKAVTLLATAIIICFSVTASNAAQSGLVVSHHEEFKDFTLQAVQALQGASARASGGVAPAVFRFDALGRTYELQLVDNSRLLSADVRASLSKDIQLYRGQMSDVEDSWARIVVYDGIPRGVIWDGTQMIAIEPPGNNAVGSDSSVIYSLADTYVIPGTMSCGVGNASMSGAGNARISGAAMYRNLVAELSAAQGPGATMPWRTAGPRSARCAGW